LTTPILEAAELFARTYGNKASWVSVAPGRVEILGNHTDYNEGFVMPFALDRATSVAVRPREDRLCRLVSRDFPGRAEFPVDEIQSDSSASWADYPKGVLWALGSEGVDLRGFDGAIASDVPVAAGLSSSAALEVATALAAGKLFGLEWDPMALAKLCQKAENEFVGVRCGILDQFSSLFGQPDCGLFLDCRTLEHSVLPLGDSGLSLLICDTQEKHNLISSKYNERRQECETAAGRLAEQYPSVRSLRDVSLSMLEENGQDLAENVFRRAKHVVTENDRVLAGRDALERGDLDGLGRLMWASHESSRDLFENSTEKLDFLVKTARSFPGCLGAKLCGGGFGGCTVHLARTGAVETSRDGLVEAFEDAFGVPPGSYVCGIGGGARTEQAP